MAVTAAQVKVEFRSDGADKVAGDLRSLGNATDAAAKKQGFLASAASTAMGVVGGGLILGAIDNVVSFGKSAITAGLSFEQGMANVAAVTGATGAELKQLSDLALQIGKDSIYGANEATLAIEELAKAGLSTEAILNGAADGAVALAAAGGVSLPEAASVMSNALNQFGLDASQATHVADLLAAAASTSATGVSELGESLKYVGTSAHALNMPIEDIITALAVMGDQGMVGSMAGTALNHALLSMANPTAQAADKMAELGISFTDANGAMRPLPDIIADVATATAGLTDAQRAAALETIFGVQGGRAMNALLATQSEAAKQAGKSWADYYKSVNQSGAAADQAAARMNSTMGSIEQLKGSLETLAIIGSMMVLPMFRSMIDGAAKGVDAFTGFITAIQSLIGGGNDPFTAISLAMRGFLTSLFGLNAMNQLMPMVDGLLDGLQAIADGAQAAAAVVGPMLGAAFGFLGDHIADVAAAIGGVLAVFGGLLAWSALTAVVAALGGAFLALLGPLGLLMAAGAALGIAWNRNLFGIQQKVGKAFSAVATGAKTTLAIFRSLTGVMNPVAAVVGTVGTGLAILAARFPAIAGPVGAVASIFNRLTGVLDDAGQQLSAFMDQGLNPVAAAAGVVAVGFAKLADMFPQFSGFFSGMRDQFSGWMGVAQDLGTGLVDLFRGDLSGAMLAFGNAATQVWDNVVNGLQTLATGAMELGSWVLNVGAPTVIGWLADAAGNVWDALKVAAGWAGDLVADLASWTLNVGAPTILMAAWDFASWVLPKIGAAVVDLAAWVLKVGAPTIIMGAWDFASWVLPKLGAAVVDLAAWVLNVGVPTVILAGWNLIATLIEAINENILVPLDNWILSLSAPDIVLAFGDLAQLIGSKISPAGALKVAIAIALAPFLLLSALVSLPAMVLGAVMDNMPKSIEAAVGATINIVGAIIKDSVNLGFQLFMFVAKAVGDATGISTAISIAITAVKWVGDVAKGLFGSGMNLVGSITATFPKWDWPSLPTWTWPEIPVPGWVSDLISALGGGGNSGNLTSGQVPEGYYYADGKILPIGGNGGASHLRSKDDPFRDKPDYAANLGMGKYDHTGNRDITITIKQVGAEAVAAAAAIAQAAIAAIPTSWTTFILQSGAEGVAAAAVVAQAAIAAIPTSWTTFILQTGGEAVAAAAAIAHAAIAAIPTSWTTFFLYSGADAVIGAAHDVAAAIAAIPDSKTVTISTVSIGTPKASGGYVTGGLTRLAELGPELVALPGGSWMMAMRDALYPTPMGSYVYTAAQTRAMQASLMPVGAYASGGYVGGRGPAPASGGISITFTGDFHGSNRAELNEWAAKDLLPAIAQTVRDHTRVYGGR